MKVQKSNFPRDLEAEITFLTTEEGGRKTPAFSGYRAQFYVDGQDFVVVHEFFDVVEPVYPGQTVKAYLAFTYPEYLVKVLHPGKEFLIREGQRVVARGRVTKILGLEESAKKAEEWMAKRRGTSNRAT
jgi:translation elongation factor EF-Tu-like GTPase